MLGSIAELDKMPLPPAKKGAVAPAPSKAPAAATGALGPAGFWIRVVAALIDGAIAGVVMGLLFALGIAAAFLLPSELAMFVSSGLIFLASLGFGFLFGLYYPAKKGATPGKRLLKLAIVSDTTSAGQGLGWSKAFVRLLGHLVCQFTFSLGYVMVAFTSRKQGLHDLIAKTYVVRLAR
ncbi:MAG: RDD family protein [Thermoanaerobaculia bacterium]|nr:MAG: RDD family protein [Thermoanaerobaculia bacterium]